MSFFINFLDYNIGKSIESFNAKEQVDLQDQQETNQSEVLPKGKYFFLFYQLNELDQKRIE